MMVEKPRMNWYFVSVCAAVAPSRTRRSCVLRRETPAGGPRRCELDREFGELLGDSVTGSDRQVDLLLPANCRSHS